MSWPNESVIILDSPRRHSKNGGKLVKKTIRSSRRRSIKKLARQRQRSPQKSPRRRVLRTNNRMICKNTPRLKKHDTSTDSEGPEEIIILSDDEECQVVTPTPVKINSKRPILTENSPKANGKRRRTSLPRECKSRNKRRRVMGEGPHEENDEFQVIWTSAVIPESFRNPADDSEVQEIQTERLGVEPNNFSDKFFIDTEGDRNLLLLDVLNAEKDKQANRPVEKRHKKTRDPQVPLKTKRKREGKKGKELLGRELREIIVDGCNVAMCYSNHNKFDVKGLEVVLDYFHKKGHTVKIFLPEHERKRNPDLLNTWNKQGLLVFTPSKKIGNKKITPYDDRFILEYANKCQGIVISSDRYRDLWNEKPEWRETIEQRVLQPTFVGDYVMFPEDPLGRGGPSLEAYLRR